MTGTLIESVQQLTTTDTLVLGTFALFVQALPTMILTLTNKIKDTHDFGKYVWAIPIALGVIGMVFASLTYGEVGILVALGSGIWAGVLAIISYDQTKNNIMSDLDVNTVPNEIGYIDKD